MNTICGQHDFIYGKPKDSTKTKTKPKQLELINELSKVVGHKINMQKYVVVLYANNKQKEKLRKQFHL